MTMHTILTGVTDASSVTVHLRFLQLQNRQVRDADGNDVTSLEDSGRTELSWDEAVEHEVSLTFAELSTPPEAGGHGADGSVAVDGGEEVDTLSGGGSVVRRRWPLRAVVAVETEQHGHLTRLTVRVSNDHPDRPGTTEDATRTSLLGAHVLVESDGCEFVSMVDPPAEARQIADAVRQDRCWPFLWARPTGPARSMQRPAARFADHPLRPPGGRGRERRRIVRRHRDRRDPHLAGDDDDRRGEGRGQGHRPAGGGDHRPLRRDVTGRAADSCTASSVTRVVPWHRHRRPVDRLRTGPSNRWPTVVGPGQRRVGRPGERRRVVDGVAVRKGSLVRVHPSVARTHRTCSSPTRWPA